MRPQTQATVETTNITAPDITATDITAPVNLGKDRIGPRTAVKRGEAAVKGQCPAVMASVKEIKCQAI